MSAAGSAISIRDVDVHYGNLKVLHDVSVEVAAGEMLVLLGPSGSGKTTLLMAIAGFAQPDRGHIEFGGREVTTLPPHRRNIGMIFQNYALFPHMDVASNIAYPLRLRRVPKSTVNQKVRQALELVRLSGFADRRIEQLSGGQRQRVAVARAIVFSPKILLLDEPLSALDKNLREEMQFELRRIHRDTGATTISVTHDQREALTMADRIAVMEAGRIAQIDTPKSIYERPRSRFVAEFIGDSNLIAAEAATGDVTSPFGPLTVAAPPRSDGSCWVVIRPERLRVVGGAASNINRIIGTVVESVYQGESCIVKIKSGDQELRVRVAATDPTFASIPRPGAALTLTADPADLIVVTR
jgi:putative spermidine/putrescine transport system ATP-binding protein